MPERQRALAPVGVPLAVDGITCNVWWSLRTRGVEVLYLRELLTEALEVPAARDEALASALRREAIGPTLAATLSEHLAELPAGELAGILIAGMAHGELPVGGGLVDRMTEPLEFIIRPLPNVLFTRDSSVWLENGSPSLSWRSPPAGGRPR